MKYISKLLAAIFTIAIFAGCADSFEIPDNDENKDNVENNDNNNSNNDGYNDEFIPLAPTEMPDNVILYKSSDWRIVSTNYYFECKSNTIESGNGQIILNEVITNLPNYAFKDRDNLAGVTLPSAIISIGENAFYDCDALTRVSLSPKLKYINAYAFSLCKNLKTITFPASLESIDDRAFSYCDNLTSIYCMAPIPPILYKDVFSVLYSSQKQIRVYVPKPSLEAYKRARDWVSNNVTFEFIGCDFE